MSKTNATFSSSVAFINGNQDDSLSVATKEAPRDLSGDEGRHATLANHCIVAGRLAHLAEVHWWGT